MKRQQLAEKWAEYYPMPLAELIAVLTEPFDGDRQDLTRETLLAHKAARREIRSLFAGHGKRPAGGEIEVPLRDIANRLLKVLTRNDSSSVATQRVQAAISRLGAVASQGRQTPTEELAVPDSVRKLDGNIPFAMWR